MDKFRKLIILVVVICISAILFSESSVYRVQAIRGLTASPDIKVSFSVIGDIHGNTENLENAIRDFHSIDPKLDLMVLNGDVVDQGIEGNYRSIERCLNKCKFMSPGIIVKNIGNHEYYDYAKGVNSPKDVETFKARYLKFSGENNVYHDKWVKGYHFISLGSEKCYTPEMGAVMADISDKQQKWLTEKLAEGYEKGKPIFVFLHQPLEMDIAGSKYNWKCIKQDEEIKEILYRFPEAIVFSSHTHSPLDFSGMSAKQPIKTAHTGSLNTQLLLDSKGNRKNIDGSQGIYVEVHQDRVVIRGRDFKEKSWKGKMEYNMSDGL